MKTKYDSEFYAGLQDSTSDRTMRLMAYTINKIIRPDSVLDVGCGTGLLLSKFKRKQILGIDLFEGKSLLIPEEKFLQADFSRGFPSLSRKFDVAISLETGEHLNSSLSDSFVAFLCKASDNIVFSAAILLQIGTHHVNCQWQSYWAKKFIKHGFGVVDCIRPLLWETDAASCYRQNTLLYTKWPKKYRQYEKPILDLVCPEEYLLYADPKRTPWRTAIRGVLGFPERLIRNHIMR